MTGPDRDLFYDHLPVYTGGNVFFNGAQPCDRERDFARETEHPVTLTLEEKDGAWTLCTDLYRYLPDVPASVISTEVLGEAFEPEQKFEITGWDAYCIQGRLLWTGSGDPSCSRAFCQNGRRHRPDGGSFCPDLIQAQWKACCAAFPFPYIKQLQGLFTVSLQLLLQLSLMVSL